MGTANPSRGTERIYVWESIMLKIINKIRRDERGVSALEYAILAAIVVGAVAVGGSALSSTTGGIPYLFSQLMSKISGKVSSIS
jgi:pilus assembly protein Flp/PilA